jgi:hypothetical protein
MVGLSLQSQTLEPALDHFVFWTLAFIIAHFLLAAFSRSVGTEETCKREQPIWMPFDARLECLFNKPLEGQIWMLLEICLNRSAQRIGNFNADLHEEILLRLASRRRTE